MLTQLKVAVITMVLAIGLATAGARPACADTYQVSGFFDTTSYSGPLNGGSFSGTFSTTGPLAFTLPCTSIPTFDVSLFNSSGTLLAELTNSTTTALALDATSAGDGDLIGFGLAQTFLQLQFPPGSSGIGPVLPFSSRLGANASFAGIGTNTILTDSGVASGQVSLVPEPGTLLLLGMGFGLLGRKRTAKRESVR